MSSLWFGDGNVSPFGGDRFYSGSFLTMGLSPEPMRQEVACSTCRAYSAEHRQPLEVTPSRLLLQEWLRVTAHTAL